MDPIGSLLHGVGQGITNLFASMFEAFGAAVRGSVAALSSVLPGALLPIVAFLVILVVGWNLAKR